MHAVCSVMTPDDGISHSGMLLLLLMMTMMERANYKTKSIHMHSPFN